MSAPSLPPVQLPQPVRGFEPRGGRVVVKLDPAKEREGLIWLPNPARPNEHVDFGRVVAWGAGMKVKKTKKSWRQGWQGPVDASGNNRWPMPDVKIGDHIIFQTMGRYTQKIEVDGEEFTIVPDDAVIGVIEDGVTSEGVAS